jgi:DNA-binding FadR family transcriptional regulator
MIAGIVTGMVAGFLITEYGEVAPWIAGRLIRWAVRRLYTDTLRAEIRLEELAALIEERPGKLLKLLTALGYAGAALGSVTARRARAIVGRRPAARLADEQFAQKLREQLGSLGELRRGIEPVAAALAARHATADQCGTLTRAALQMEAYGRSGDLEAFLAADILFHRTLLEASGNTRLGALANMVAAMLTGRTRYDLMPAHPETAAIHWHTEVAKAVRAGDGVVAERAMRDIVDEATKTITDRSH